MQKFFIILFSVLLIITFLFALFFSDNIVKQPFNSLNQRFDLLLNQGLYLSNGTELFFLYDTITLPLVSFTYNNDTYFYVALFYGNDEWSVNNYYAKEFRIIFGIDKPLSEITPDLNLKDSFTVTYDISVNIPGTDISNYYPETLERQIEGSFLCDSAYLDSSNGSYNLIVNLNESGQNGFTIPLDFGSLAISFNYIYQDLENSEPVYDDSDDILTTIKKIFVLYPEWLLDHITKPFRFYGFNDEVLEWF